MLASREDLSSIVIRRDFRKIHHNEVSGNRCFGTLADDAQLGIAIRNAEHECRLRSTNAIFVFADDACPELAKGYGNICEPK